MKLYKYIENNINKIKNLNVNSSDLCIRNLFIKGRKISIIYLASVASDDKVSDFLIRSVKDCLNNIGLLDNTFKTLENSIFNSNLSVEYSFDNIKWICYYSCKLL